MSSCWWQQHSCVVEFDEFSREKPVQWEEVFISKNSYHYVKRRLYNPSSLSWAVTAHILWGTNHKICDIFPDSECCWWEKQKKEKEGFVVMIVELFFLVSGCIQSSIQINNLDVWGFIFFLRSDLFPLEKGMFPYWPK